MEGGEHPDRTAGKGHGSEELAGARTGPGWLTRPCPTLRYIVYSRMFALGCAVHLTLPDTHQADWVVPDLAIAIGAIVLAVSGSAAGWALCAVGLAVPLVFLSDQLTQSLYLLVCSLTALICFAGSRSGRSDRMDRSLALSVRVLTVGTYAAAAMHKLNEGFVDAGVSCASGGIRILAENWGIEALASPELAPVWPILFIVVESTLAVLFVVRPGWALALGTVMHLPLTIIFAPAFAFTMIGAWVMFLSEDELRHLAAVLRRHLVLIVSTGLALGTLSIALYVRGHDEIYPVWFLKELSLWVALIWAFVAQVKRPPGVFGWWSAWKERVPRAGRAVAVILGALWALNAVTPYTGLKFHHSAAMLSNLRIDHGCWNSLIFPESVRLRDPYIHFEEVSLGEVRGREQLVALIKGRLWDNASLTQHLPGWCEAGASPLHVKGHRGGERFDIPDLCRRSPFDGPWLPGYRAFQQNLSPQCPQQCIH